MEAFVPANFTLQDQLISIKVLFWLKKHSRIYGISGTCALKYQQSSCSSDIVLHGSRKIIIHQSYGEFNNDNTISHCSKILTRFAKVIYVIITSN